jgi:predicted DNA-binding transcriptional regulator AlpA
LDEIEQIRGKFIMTEVLHNNLKERGFITMKEALRILGYKSSASIYGLVREGRLNKYKVLGKAFYSLEEIEALLNPSLDSLAPKPEELQSVEQI